MQFKSRIKNLSLAAIIGCAALLSAGASRHNKPSRPLRLLRWLPLRSWMRSPIT